MKLVSQYMIVKETFEKSPKVRSESDFLREKTVISGPKQLACPKLFLGAGCPLSGDACDPGRRTRAKNHFTDR